MATIRKLKNETWELQYYNFDNKRIRKSLGKIDKDKATVELEKINYQQYLAKIKGVRVKGSIKYRDYSKLYLKWYERAYPSSFDEKMSNFVIHLDKLFDNIALDKLTEEMVEDMIEEKYEQGLAPATINKILTDLIAFLNRAKQQKHSVPDFKIEKVADNESKPAKFHSIEALQDLYDHSPNHWHWWMLLVNTGMRLGELQKLRCENVRDDSLYVISTNKRRTKSGKFRVIGLNDKALKALAKFDRSGEFLFPQNYSRQTIGTALTRCAKRAGIVKGKWGVHCLRHSFGSHMAMAGVSMASIQDLMGHANMKTTEIYIHLSPDHQKKSVNAISL